MSFMKRDREPLRTPPASAPAPRPYTAPQPALKNEVATPTRDSVPTVSEPPEKTTAKPEAPVTAIPVNREAAAVIDTKSKIKGTLHTEGNVLVEGVFEGEIDARETVWVEKGSQTDAQLRANDVIISGSFNGEVDCRHRLQIAATATVSGEIKTPVLVIAEGATINCRFSMTRSGGKSK